MSKSKYNWKKIQLYRDAVEGLDALAKLTGEKPQLILSKKAQTIFEQTEKMQVEFYKLDIQERLYESGMATRPGTKS